MTSFPTATTVPPTSLPLTGSLGLVNPYIGRKRYGTPLMYAQSAGLIAMAPHPYQNLALGHRRRVYVAHLEHIRQSEPVLDNCLRPFTSSTYAVSVCRKFAYAVSLSSRPRNLLRTLQSLSPWPTETRTEPATSYFPPEDSVLGAAFVPIRTSLGSKRSACDDWAKRGLGVEAMTPHNHVASKEDILDGMVDIVVGEIDPPDHQDRLEVGDAARRSSQPVNHSSAILGLSGLTHSGEHVPDHAAYMDSMAGISPHGASPIGT